MCSSAILAVRIHVNVYFIDRNDISERQAVHIYKPVKNLKGMRVRSMEPAGNAILKDCTRVFLLRLKTD